MDMNTKRRTLIKALLGVGGLLALPTALIAATKPQITVYKTASCGCCKDWIVHLEQNGFAVLAHDVPGTGPYRERYGVPRALASCHTAVIDGYAIEGHVPADDIKRLITEKPKARGLSVPGMPVGSPGMEVRGERRDAFDVVLFDDDGRRQIYRHYEAQ
jgi:hypothetical protein